MQCLTRLLIRAVARTKSKRGGGGGSRYKGIIYRYYSIQHPINYMEPSTMGIGLTMHLSCLFVHVSCV